MPVSVVHLLSQVQYDPLADLLDRHDRLWVWSVAVAAIMLLLELAIVTVRYRRARQPDATEPRCGRCGYLTRGLPSCICPECGNDLSAPGAMTIPARVAPPLAMWRLTFWLIVTPLPLLAAAAAINNQLPKWVTAHSSAHRAGGVNRLSWYVSSVAYGMEGHVQVHEVVLNVGTVEQRPRRFTLTYRVDEQRTIFFAFQGKPGFTVEGRPTVAMIKEAFVRALIPEYEAADDVHSDMVELVADQITHGSPLNGRRVIPWHHRLIGVIASVMIWLCGGVAVARWGRRTSLANPDTHPTPAPR